ncbi:MAG: hypothetical protein DHS20C18_31320 [Saprospiraceae bacterium]|nr:MAG: hypothetical protein DHS20C18_31320 [Saprospiraceae bacterium]
MALGFTTLKSAAQMANQDITEVVTQFVEAGDAQDVKSLEKVIHDSYRIVWNDLNEKAVKVVDRATYLQLIGAKKFGGDVREIHIESIAMRNEVNAVVRVSLVGKKADFWSFLSLIKVGGKWLIVEDMIDAKFK